MYLAIAIALLLDISELSELINSDSFVANSISFGFVLLLFVSLFVVIFATKVASAIFGIDFYVVYQIMVFGQCLSSTNSK